MQSSQLIARPSKRGFTVTELLVVIVIVAVLAVIGFSVANKVRTKAKTLGCLNRVKNWSTVIVQANTDLGGGRMHCPNSFMSIGSGGGALGGPESPFTLYWAEMAGLSLGPDRNEGALGNHMARRPDYDQVIKISGENRSCPCFTNLPAAPTGNIAWSYVLNTYLQKPGTTGFKVVDLQNIRRLSKKIYFMDGVPNGPQDLHLHGQGRFISGLQDEVVDKHGGSINALFLDMHIEQITPDELDKDWRAYTQLDE